MKRVEPQKVDITIGVSEDRFKELKMSCIHHSLSMRQLCEKIIAQYYDSRKKD